MNHRRLLNIFIIAQWLLILGANAAAIVEKRHLPAALKSQLVQVPATLSASFLLLAVLAFACFIMYLATSIALYKMRPWAKWPYVFSGILGFALLRAFLGTTASTPITGMIHSLYLSCVGLTAGLLLFSKVLNGRDSGNIYNDRAQVPGVQFGEAEATPSPGNDTAAAVPDTHAAIPVPFFKSLVSNLKSGLRASAFLKVTASHFIVSTRQLLALVGMDLVLSFLMNFIRVGMNGEFNVDYLPFSLFYLPLMVAASYLIADLESKPDLEFIIPIALISAGIWIEIAGSMIGTFLNRAWLYEYSFLFSMDHYYHLFGWWLIASLLILWRLGGPFRDRKPVFVFLFVVATPFWLIPKWDLWTESYNDTDTVDPKKSITQEYIFYSQPILLDRQLSELKPGRKGVIDLYFVGFGADSSQDVFMKEIDVTKKLFDERFDTRGRSIALINNNKTVESVPIATRTALEKTIRRIAAIMNKDEDVLFLYLTSHGSDKYMLSVNFWPLRLSEIHPNDIKDFLDRSGITWKVIAVSACYSGGYIDPLKADTALVLTSADEKHTSFGCSNESEFTYFGKAYFNDALRNSHSFIASFDTAKEAILQREQQESEEPSNPQMHAGGAIRKHLQELEKRLRSHEN